MHAVIRTGGKQYLVEPGKTYSFEKLPGAEGETVTFDDVLLTFTDGTFTDGGADAKVGTPTVAGASVTGKIVRQMRERKIIVIKYKAKSRYRRKAGHRQQVTEVRIEAISCKP